MNENYDDVAQTFIEIDFRTRQNLLHCWLSTVSLSGPGFTL